MAATSDEEMENLLSLADQISTDFETSISEIQTLKSNLAAAINHRQSLELTCAALTRENERYKNLHLQTLNNLLNQFQRKGENSINLRQELEKLTGEMIKKEEDHRIELQSVNRSYEEKIRVLEGQIGEILSQKGVDEATIYQLHRELISMRNRLKEVEGKYSVEVDDLRDCISVEQEEKKELCKRVKDLEKELFVSKAKMIDQHSSCEDKQLDLMKQKMMKLRKENQGLKRQLSAKEI